MFSLEDEGNSIVYANVPYRLLKGLKKVIFRGEIVGAVGFDVVGGEMTVRVLYILPEHRGSGVAKEFIDWLVEEAKKNGISKVYVIGSRESTLYADCGFTWDGERWVKSAEHGG